MRLLLILLLGFAGTYAADLPRFTEEGDLAFPANYRNWVFLSTGLGMTYGPAASMALENPMFDNVYVTPSAFASFQQTGRWPEGTMFVLEIRYSTSHGSINKGGFYQTDIAAIEVAVKDSKRYSTGWAYFDFSGGMRALKKTAKEFGQNSRCHSCHTPNGAVENTFVQFYPTALAIAEKKGTVKSSYKAPAPSPASAFHQIREKKATPRQLLNAAQELDRSAPVVKESTLNMMAATLLQQGDPQQAIAVLEWSATAYPHSANTQDSLAEAYEAGGNKEKARTANAKAQQLLAGDPTLTAERKQRLEKAIAERMVRLR
ncbi:MAG: cytochrome P460 family protein [Bryobacterales bacterium]|nr:cytochrome P460 family protein [Bryobacterales bacterium]